MKEKYIHFLRYVNKFGLSLAIQLFYKTRTSKKKIENIDLNNQLIQLRPGTTDVFAFDLIFLWEEYKLPQLNFKPELIIDCGANIGLATVYFSNKYKDALCYCIEPSPENIPILELNVKQNKNVKIFPYALMSSSEDVFISKLSAPAAFDDFVVEKQAGDNTEKVKAITLNEILSGGNHTYIDILKIDIEGSEKEVFAENYSEWLGKTKIIIIELHDRMKHGCSKNFFTAISKFDFDFEIKNESLIGYNRSLISR